jgi:hypothetical protein
LRFGGKGRGRRRIFFLGAKDFFYREGRRVQKSSLLEIWRGGGGRRRIFSDQGFFYREREKELF